MSPDIHQKFIEKYPPCSEAEFETYYRNRSKLYIRLSKDPEYNWKSFLRDSRPYLDVQTLARGGRGVFLVGDAPECLTSDLRSFYVGCYAPEYLEGWLKDTESHEREHGRNILRFNEKLTRVPLIVRFGFYHYLNETPSKQPEEIRHLPTILIPCTFCPNLYQSLINDPFWNKKTFLEFERRVSGVRNPSSLDFLLLEFSLQ